LSSYEYRSETKILSGSALSAAAKAFMPLVAAAAPNTAAMARREEVFVSKRDRSIAILQKG
jgi:hypothetical protein